MSKMQIFNTQFYGPAIPEAGNNLDVESSKDGVDTEDYVDMEGVIRDVGRFFVDDDDPSDFEFDTNFDDFDIDGEDDVEDEDVIDIIFGH